MRKKIILLLIFVVCFLLVGCGKNKNIENSNSNSSEVKTKLSCYKDGYLFHSKKRVENKISLDKNNKLIDYEYIEVYSDFDNDEEFNMICDGSYEEAENNNKMYNYLNQIAVCNRDTRIVTISNKYNLLKIPSKNVLESKYVKDNLDADYIFYLENYKSM